MLIVTEPRPPRAADARGARAVVAASAASGTPSAPTAARVIDDWLDDEPPVRSWSRAEALDLRRRKPSLSPWRVVLWQVAVAVVGALVGLAATGSASVALSALYGGLVVAVPGALMARAATRDVTGVAPAVGALSMLAFQAFKLLATLLLLALAPRVLPELNWPALLATLVVGLQTYWVALAVRPRPTPSSQPA